MQLITSIIRQYWLAGLVVVLLMNFSLSALQGEAGLFRYFQLSAQISTLSAERDSLVEKRKILANLTHRLSDNYLDLDLLDEQVRNRLGLVRDDEIIIR